MNEIRRGSQLSASHYFKVKHPATIDVRPLKNTTGDVAVRKLAAERKAWEITGSAIQVMIPRKTHVIVVSFWSVVDIFSPPSDVDGDVLAAVELDSVLDELEELGVLSRRQIFSFWDHGPGLRKPPEAFPILPNAVTSPTTTEAGYMGSPINTQNGTYSTVLTDRGKTIYHTSASTHTFTIDDTLSYPDGTIIAFNNENGGGNVTIAINNSATLRWGSSTGSRTLAANGQATAQKMAASLWRFSGSGIS